MTDTDISKISPDGAASAAAPGSAPGASVGAVIGRVGAPAGAEASSEEFTVWTAEDVAIEKTQLVCVDSAVGNTPTRFYGLVSEVFRRSRRSDMLEEADRFDGRPTEPLPPVESRGVTYARVRVLATDPQLYAPPREEAVALAAGETEARAAYRIGEMEQPMSVGLIRNGAVATAGPASVDLDYLLGANGGHMNVTGIAGVGTKSSFLTVSLAQLIRICHEREASAPTDAARLRVIPVIFNVKGFDLFWIDHFSTSFSPEDRTMWRAMGVDDPRPFDADFFAPQQPGSEELSVPVGRPGVRPYSWSLRDVLASGLFGFLFSDAEREDDNFALLLADLERLLVRERRTGDGRPTREVHPDAPARTFTALFDWFAEGLAGTGDAAFMRLEHGHHHPGTLRRFYRRLRRIVYESSGIFRLDDGGSHPLDITTSPLGRVQVVDIHSLPDRHLQRFVVAALMRQAVDDQTGPQARAGLHYVFCLDELNRFAPRGASDPITQLIETIAAELRSRGVILFGAQQQATLVSTRVVENAAIRLLGRTGGHELRADVHAWLPDSLRAYAERLEPADKILHAPTFREAMHVRVPRPPWAMRRAEASPDPPASLADVAGPGRPGPRRVSERRWEDQPR